MERQIVYIEENDIFKKAEADFIKICGFDLEKNEKHKRMMKLADEVREKGIEGIEPKSIVVFSDNIEIENSKLIVDGKLELECKYFEQLDTRNIEGMYMYILTAGECYFESEEKIMDFLYADIWGTAYVDAGIDSLKRNFVEQDVNVRFKGRDVWISEEFGPGYFGMGMIESKKMTAYLNSQEIGVRTKENGLIIPQKSCVGFYLVYNKEIKAERACVTCLGNKISCDFCKKNGEK